MIDSVLKGTGNSRFLKSAVPAGTSWADALAMLQAGTFPIDFNGINTEGFQQVGTPLNKANLLKDATAAQIGLPPSTTPDGMFQALGNTGELHVWRKTVKNAADVPAGYNLGTKTQMNIAKTQYTSGSDIALYIDVASSVTVSDSGDVSLSNATRSKISLQSNYSSKIQSSVRGKFVTFTPVRSGIVTTPSGIYFIPSDATVSYTYAESGNPVFAYDISAAQTVTGYPLTPAGTTTTYPVSTNPNVYQEGSDAKEAGYTLGEVVTGTFQFSAGNNVSPSWYYSDVISVSDDGKITLQSSNYITLYDGSSISDASVLVGKFIMPVAQQTSPIAPFMAGMVYFIPSNATFSRSGHLYIDRYQPVTGYAAIPAGTTIEYLGKLGDKARVQFGSYVGTGTYGYDNPNTLTFDFVPKLVIISGYTSNGYTTVTFVRGASSAGYPANGVNYFSMKLSWKDKKVSWYNTSYDADQQANKSGYRYNYVAIG